MAPPNAAVGALGMSRPARSDGALAPFTAGKELRRKALHLATAVVPVLYARGLPRESLLFLLAIGTLAALAIEWLRRVHPGSRSLFNHTVGSLLRPHERDSLSGATWLCLSCFLAVLFLPAVPAVAAMWCATIGDSIAALTGRAWSGLRNAQAPIGKTLVGSLACWGVSAAGVWWLTGIPAASALTVGAAAAVAEYPSAPFDDNFRVMLVAGVVALLLT